VVCCVPPLYNVHKTILNCVYLYLTIEQKFYEIQIKFKPVATVNNGLLVCDLCLLSEKRNKITKLIRGRTQFIIKNYKMILLCKTR